MLKPRGQVGLNFKNSIEMIEAGSLVWGHNAGVSAVCSAVASAGSGLLIQSGFPVFTKNIVFSVLLGFLLPLWCLTFAVEGLGAEREGKTLFWLFSKPVPRSSIYIGKFLAILPWVLIWSLGGFFILAVCAGECGLFAFKLFWQPIALASVTYASVFFFTRLNGNGQGSFDGAQQTIQRQFAHDNEFTQAVSVDLSTGGQNSHRDGQVVGGTFFADIGRGEIDDGFGAGHAVASTKNSRFNALKSFTNGIIRQTHQMIIIGADYGLSARIHFHCNGAGVHSMNRTGKCFDQHVLRHK
jgi:hypothetical protein